MNGNDNCSVRTGGFANRRKDRPQTESLGKVKVIHGSHDETFDNLVDMNVATVLASLKQIFNIADDAVASVNGVKVSMDHRLVTNDVLEFIKPFGQKGLGDLLTPEQILKRWDIDRKQYEKFISEGMPTEPLDDGSVRHFEYAVDEWQRSRVSKHPGRTTKKPSSGVTPRWDEITKRLYVGKDLIKNLVKCSSTYGQLRILKEFEAAGWPTFLQDPFGDNGTGNFEDSTSETVSGLNKNHKTTGILRFHMHNKVGIRWEITGPTKGRGRSRKAP